MIKILTWNIQCGRGVDDRVDLERVANVIKGMGDADVICLQEVSRYDCEMDGGKGADQVTTLRTFFPDHMPIFGPALNRQGYTQDQRRQFGNLILSRLPIIQVFEHLLPQPATTDPCKHMPRQALEVVVDIDNYPLRITTTHLEFHSEAQRMAQARRLVDVQCEVVKNQQYNIHAPPSGPYAAISRPAQSILCGDFNSGFGNVRNDSGHIVQCKSSAIGDRFNRSLENPNGKYIRRICQDFGLYLMMTSKVSVSS